MAIPEFQMDISRTTTGVERGPFHIVPAEYGGFIVCRDAFGREFQPRPMFAGSLHDALAWLQDRLQPVVSDGPNEPTIKAA